MKKLFSILLGFILFLSVLPVASSAEVIQLPQIAKLSNVGTVDTADFSSDDLFFATGSRDGEIAVWKTSDGTLINKWSNVEDRSDRITKLLYGTTGEIIYTSNSRGIVQAWDINSGTSTTLISNSSNRSINDLTLNADGTTLYAANSDGNKVIYLDTLTGNEETAITLTSAPVTLAYNTTYQHLAIGLANGTIAIHDAVTGAYIQTITESNGAINTLAYSTHDDYLYASVYGYSTYQLNQYNVEKQYEKVKLATDDFKTSASTENYTELSLSSNNRFMVIGLVSGHTNGLEIFDTRSKKKIATSDLYQVHALAISHNNQRILAGSTLLNASVLPNRELEGLEAKPAANLVSSNTDQTIAFNALYSDGTKTALAASEVSVSSSENKVAKFQYGKLFALSEGKAIITVNYQGFTTSFEVVVSDVIELPAELNVSVDKTWTMTLSNNVSVDTIRQKNVYVEDSKGNIFPMLYYVEQSNLKQVKLIPATKYVSGETYTIWVKDIQSNQGQTIKYTKKTFTVR